MVSGEERRSSGQRGERLVDAVEVLCLPHELSLRDGRAVSQNDAFAGPVPNAGIPGIPGHAGDLGLRAEIEPTEA